MILKGVSNRKASSLFLAMQRGIEVSTIYVESLELKVTKALEGCPTLFLFT